MEFDIADTRGQSEVIGSVLLIGIVVIAAAAAGSVLFELFGEHEQDVAPQTKFEVEQFGADGQKARLHHSAGDVIEDVGTITVRVDGTNVSDGSGFSGSGDGLSSQDSLYIAYDGTDITVTDSISDVEDDDGLAVGTEIDVIWNSNENEMSAVLFEHEIEDRS